MRLALLLVLCLTLPAVAADDWQAAVATVKITPDKPIPLAGYAHRTKPFESVDLDIWARALALKDAAGNRALLITLDLCIIPRAVIDPVRKQIAEAHKLEPAAILVSLSHTHSGPAVSLQASADPRDRVNAGGADTVEYTKALQQKIVDLAAKALDERAFKPASLSWGTGLAHFALNRRQFTEKGVILGNNPRGLVDRSVPVLRIDGADAKPLAILFGYACHGTTVQSSHLGISPDFPGYARKAIEEHFPGATALFIAGCGGDANPFPRQQPGQAEAHGQTLAAEVCRVAESKLAPVTGSLKCALATADLPLETPANEELLKITGAAGNSTRKNDAAAMLAKLNAGQKLPRTHGVPVSAWQFGSDLTLVALPNEVVVDYVPRLEQALGPLKLWIGAYCHEVEGYIPSARVLKEGGYETRGLYINTGWFTPAAEQALIDAVRSAASAAGRPITESTTK